MGRLTGITSVTAGRSLLRFFWGSFSLPFVPGAKRIGPGRDVFAACVFAYLGFVCLEIGQGLCTGCCFPALLSRNLEFL